jgi:hypothetical protein
MMSIFGIRPSLDELLHKSIKKASADYGFDIDPRLVTMMVEEAKRDMIRAYVYGRIGHTETIFVPMTGKRQHGDEYGNGYTEDDYGVAV